MPSVKSRFFIFMLRYQNILRFQFKRKPMVDWHTSIPDLRRKTEKAGKLLSRTPAGIVSEAIEINGRHAEWVTAPAAEKNQAILYFHGGGYVIGSAQGHRPHVAKVVAASGVPALVFDYRLAPEHPFPAALHDSLAAFQYLLNQGIAAHRIVFMGDSAGGGLCLAALLALKDQGKPLPAAAVALSPWTDLLCTGASLTTNEKVDLLTWRESWTVFSRYYVADQDPALPYISPLYGTLNGLPPLLLYVGDDELLRDDTTRFAEKAQRAGVTVTLRVGPGMFHCYPICAPLFPEATAAMTELGAFINKHSSCRN
jgi:epsilon-lactone hydrolase